MEKKNERGRELREGGARRPVTFWRRWGGYGPTAVFWPGLGMESAGVGLSLE
jgi:hypothetical protein